jgi:thiol-disulfide isomerase/thioredoxin
MRLKITTLFFITTLAALADEKLPLLSVKGDVYSNVTVFKVTAADIYFTHARGIGNAKLKDLSPELQQLFHYDADKSQQAETQRTQASSEYFARVRENRPAPPNPPGEAEQASSGADGDDFVVPRLYARSFRGQRAPAFVVEKWLTAQPDTAGKFVLIDFWATWCRPCRRSIPELNAFHAKYKNRLAVIGVSNETEAEVRRMRAPKIDYAVAIDTMGRMSKVLEIRGIPHCILIDPKGVVRYEGMPQYLNDRKLEHFLEKYSK